jgi:hypothetical protein
LESNTVNLPGLCCVALDKSLNLSECFFFLIRQVLALSTQQGLFQGNVRMYVAKASDPGLDTVSNNRQEEKGGGSTRDGDKT